MSEPNKEVDKVRRIPVGKQQRMEVVVDKRGRRVIIITGPDDTPQEQPAKNRLGIDCQ